MYLTLVDSLNHVWVYIHPHYLNTIICSNNCCGETNVPQSYETCFHIILSYNCFLFNIHPPIFLQTLNSSKTCLGSIHNTFKRYKSITTRLNSFNQSVKLILMPLIHSSL